MARWVFLLGGFYCGCATVGYPKDAASLVQLEGDAIVVKEAIRFAHGEAVLEARSKELLDAVAKLLLSTASISRLTLEGHADATGDPAANLPLSEARAQAVKKYLESKGVHPSRLEVVARGSSQPVDTNDTEAGRARNRRVEFKVR